jgi:hypothetical protein
MVKRGWVARGGFGDDSLDVAVFNMWYSMLVTSNVPPDVQFTSVLHTTFFTSPRTVDAEILDCDPENPSRAGTKLASLKWQIDGVRNSIFHVPTEVLMEADIPCARLDRQFNTSYAEDSTGRSPPAPHHLQSCSTK